MEDIKKLEKKIENYKKEFKINTGRVRLNMGKDDFGFKVNLKTGKLILCIPKREEFTGEELITIAISLCRACAPFGLVFGLLADEKSESNEKET